MSQQSPLQTPWTTNALLDQCVCVLLAKYVTSEAEDALFYAVVENGGKAVPVQPDGVGAFLESHKANTFIMYDAAEFYRQCLQAVDGQPQHQSRVRQLAQTSRLWDIGLLDRRIRFACQEKNVRVLGEEHLHGLYRQFLDTDYCELRSDKKVAQLKEILVRMLDRAVREIPVFKMLIPITAEELVGDDLGNDRFCNEIAEMDNVEICEQNTIEDDNDYFSGYEEQYSVLKIRRDRQEEYPEFILDRLKVNRRINVLLSAPNGPLGIGMDLQEVLLADVLNHQTLEPDLGRLEDIVRNIDGNARESINNPLLSKYGDVKACFKWRQDQEDNTVSRDKRGYVCKNDKSLPQVLEKIFDPASRDINIPFSLPRDCQGKLLLGYADWLKYRPDSDFIKAWTDMEAVGIATNARRNQNNPFCSYTDFPCLRSAVVEVLSDSAQEPFLSLPQGQYFAEIRFNDLDLRSILATNVALYGLLPEMQEVDYHKEQEYPVSLCAYIVDNITKMIEQFNALPPARKDEEKTMGQLKMTWESLSDEQKNKTVKIIASGCKKHWSNDRQSSCLNEAGIQLNTIDVGPLRSAIWLHLVSCQRPKYKHTSKDKETSLSAPAPELIKHGGPYRSDTIDAQYDELLLTQFLFQRAVDQICYKMDLSQLSHNVESKSGLKEKNFGLRGSVSNLLRKEVAQKSTPEQIRERTGIPYWTIINHLEKIGKDAAYMGRNLISDLQYRTKTITSSQDTIFQRVKENLRSLDVKTFYMTNSVSSTGRVGAPIHYVNATEADAELFRQSIPTQIAFSLLAANHEIVWVSNNAVLVRLRAGEEEAQLTNIAMTARAKAMEIFQTASVSRSGFQDWLARGLCTCQVLDAWPNGNVIHPHDDAFSRPGFHNPELPKKQNSVTYFWGGKHYSQEEYDKACMDAFDEGDIVYDDEDNIELPQ